MSLASLTRRFRKIFLLAFFVFMATALIITIVSPASVQGIFSGDPGDGGGDPGGGGPPPVTAAIRANGQTGAINVAPGSGVVISWSSSNADSCTVSPGGYSGTTGSQNVTINSTVNYTISCTNAEGSSAGSNVLVSIAGGGASGAAHPTLEVRLGDAGSGSPSLPGQCNNQVTGWGSSATDSDDPDCVAVRVTNQSSVYTEDFQVCFGLNGATRCTPWASEGGGSSGLSVAGNSFNTAAISVNYRTSPSPGMYYTNTVVGVRLAYRSNGSSCGPSSGFALAYGTPGQASESPWAYGAANDDDPGCGEVWMYATGNLPNDAQFVSEDVPATTAANTNLNGYKITMKNLGATWVADQSTQVSGNCSNFQPTQAGQTCTETKDHTSSNFVLARTNNPSGLSAPEQLPFKKRITYTYTATEYEWCETSDPPDPGGGGILLNQFPSQPKTWWQKALAIVENFIPTVFAQGQICTTELVTVVSSTDSANVNLNGQAEFPINIGVGAVAGTYTVSYRMKQLTGIPNGNPASEFGEVADVVVTIVDDGNYGLTCTPADLGNIAAGDPDATFNVLATTSNSYNGAVLLSGTSDRIDNSNNVLGPGNLAIAFTTNPINPSGVTNTNVTVSGFQPNTRYRVTVNGSPSASGNPSSCQVVVNVLNYPQNGSKYVSHSVTPSPLYPGQSTITGTGPLTLYTGQSAQVTVVMKNARPDGTINDLNTWYAIQAYALGSETPRNNVTWGPNRVSAPPTVLPGGTATFTFTITAPSTPTTGTLQWGMVKGVFTGETDSSSWFDTAPNGEMTPGIPVQVVPRNYSLTCAPSDLGTIHPGEPNPILNASTSTTTGYNDPVALSGSSSPAGLTFTPSNATVNPAGGSNPTNSNFTISGFQPNINYTITISGSPASGSGSSSCTAVLQVDQPPTASFTATSSLSFSADQNAPLPSSQNVTLTNTGTVALSIASTKTQAWLNNPASSPVSLAVGETKTVSVSPNTTSLAPNTYNDTITFSDVAGAGATPRTTAVTYQIGSDGSGEPSYTLTCVPTDIGVLPGDPDPIFTVFAESENGFTGDITLTADSVIEKTGAPGNLTANIDTNPLKMKSKNNPPVATDVTVSNFQASTSYIVTISGSPQIGKNTPSCSVKIDVGDNNGGNPSATLLCSATNGGYTAGPCTVSTGNSGYVSWTSLNATSCSVAPAIFYSNPRGPNSSGEPTNPINTTTTFTLTCTSAKGATAVSSVTFNTTSGAPSLQTSEKDIVSVRSGSQDTLFKPTPCSLQSIDSAQLFKDGDILTMRINLCNTGNGDLNSTITITDTMANLIKPTGGWQASFECGNSCTGLVDESLYDPGAENKVIKFRFTPTAGGIPAGGGIWSVTYKAQVKAPAPADLPYYRFSNCANNINLNPAISGLNIDLPWLCMPQYLFVRSSSSPDRHEIAP